MASNFMTKWLIDESKKREPRRYAKTKLQLEKEQQAESDKRFVKKTNFDTPYIGSTAANYKEATGLEPARTIPFNMVDHRRYVQNASPVQNKTATNDITLKNMESTINHGYQSKEYNSNDLKADLEERQIGGPQAGAKAPTPNTNMSIVDYLVSKGLDHSLSSRKAMAQKYGIDTSNSYNMNVALLKRLKENEERKQIKYGDKQHMYQAQQLNASNPINLLAPQRSPEQNIKELIAQFKKGGCVKKKPKKCAEGTKVTKSGCGSKVEKNKCGGKAKKK